MAANPTRISDAGAAGSVSARLHDERYAAAYLGISVQTVRRMRARRARGESGRDSGPAVVRILSAVRYDQRALDAYIDALAQPGGGGAL
jgi:hypothetical protein